MRQANGSSSLKTRLGLCAFLMAFLLAGASDVSAQSLFVGLEGANVPVRSSDLGGFPDVNWTNHWAFDVSGAAASEDGRIYVCNGPFTTRLYSAELDSEPEYLSTASVDLHSLGYGAGTLYGFSNYANPMGIYSVEPATGACALVISTATPGYRFFGLDFNTEDGLLYGYTEYGVTGLYSIDTETGSMVRIVSPPPGVNGQGRALAVGNNTVYLLSTRGDEGEPCFAYDLAQGSGGLWISFTNPYPQSHATGGATWIPSPAGALEHGFNHASPSRLPRLRMAGPNPVTSPAATPQFVLQLERPEHVRVDVMDVSGRVVSTLADQVAPAGTSRLAWDGSDCVGQTAGGGVYLARLRTRAGQSTVKFTIIR